MSRGTTRTVQRVARRLLSSRRTMAAWRRQREPSMSGGGVEAPGVASMQAWETGKRDGEEQQEEQAEEEKAEEPSEEEEAEQKEERMKRNEEQEEERMKEAEQEIEAKVAKPCAAARVCITRYIGYTHYAYAICTAHAHMPLAYPPPTTL